MGETNQETYLTGKKIVYIDMDGVIVNFDAAFPFRVLPEEKEAAKACPEFWRHLPPMRQVIPALKWLDRNFDIFILTTVPWDVPVAATEKILWVKKYLIDEIPSLRKRIMTSHFKQLNHGEFLIDDRTKNGAGEFGKWRNLGGELIQFGSEGLETWAKVCSYLAQKENKF
jgi:5'-nucleotidase